MGRLFDQAHAAWIEVQLRAPAWAQNNVFPFLYRARDILQLRPLFPVHRLRGQLQGDPLTVDYVGLKYQPAWTNVLFTDEPAVQQVGWLPAWRLSSLGGSSNADLVVIVGSKYLLRRLPRQNALLLPFYVMMMLDTQGDWAVVRSRMHRNVRKRELRSLRRYGYAYHVSDRDEDFKLFYHRMYVPTISKRKGKLAVLTPEREAYQYFRHNGLLQMITRNGQPIASSLSSVFGKRIRFRLVGVLNGDAQLIHERALGACDYAVIHWAHHNGLASVNFGDSVPRLNNGVFQKERRWGCVMSSSTRSHKRIWIRVQRDTPAVRRFFKENPLVILDATERLHGLVVTDDPNGSSEAALREYEALYATPGLDRLIVRPAADFFKHTSSGRIEDWRPAVLTPLAK